MHERRRRGGPWCGSVERRQLGGDVGQGAVVGVPDRGRAVEDGEEVVLAPHDALGLAGGATCVEQEEVVTGPGRLAADVAVHLGGRGLLVGLGPVGAGPVAVVDPQPQDDAGKLRPGGLGVGGEGAVEHDGLDVGVTPQVDELGVDVAVVGVDRHQRGLEAGEQRLDVLRAVVQVLGDLRLASEPGAEEAAGDAVGAAVELSPGAHLVAAEHGREVGLEPGELLPHIGEVPVGHCSPPEARTGPMTDRRLYMSDPRGSGGGRPAPGREPGRHRSTSCDPCQDPAETSIGGPMPETAKGRLDGKVAVITGAARGQGEAEARLFVAEGASVVLTDVLADEVEAWRLVG